MTNPSRRHKLWVGWDDEDFDENDEINEIDSIDYAPIFTDENEARKHRAGLNPGEVNKTLEERLRESDSIIELGNKIYRKYNLEDFEKKYKIR